jgi:hypothetical protein
MPLVLAALGPFAEAAQNLAAHMEIRQKSLQYQMAAVQNERSPNTREDMWHARLLAGMLESRKTWMHVHALLEAGDTVSLAALLHSWEAAAIKLYAVEHLWQPSPFPFEMLSGGGD